MTWSVNEIFSYPFSCFSFCCVNDGGHTPPQGAVGTPGGMQTEKYNHHNFNKKRITENEHFKEVYIKIQNFWYMFGMNGGRDSGNYEQTTCEKKNQEK